MKNKTLDLYIEYLFIVRDSDNRRGILQMYGEKDLSRVFPWDKVIPWDKVYGIRSPRVKVYGIRSPRVKVYGEGFPRDNVYGEDKNPRVKIYEPKTKQRNKLRL